MSSNQRREPAHDVGLRCTAMTAPGETPQSQPRRWHDLGVRAASGIALIAVALFVTKVGGWLFLAVWLAGSIAVLWEWLKLPGGEVSRALVIGGAALTIIAILAKSEPGSALVVLAVAVAVQVALSPPDARRWIGSGQIYAGLFLLSLIALRFSFPFGSRAIIWLFAVVWSTDVFAYFGGRLFGGPKIAPRISPSKTWSGTLTGIAAGALIGTFAAARDFPMPPATVQIFLLSLLTAALSQCGDAFESALKRHYGVKDSGHLIPGHGGVMDRLDGFIAATIFAFLVGYVRSRYLPSIAGGLFYWG